MKPEKKVELDVYQWCFRHRWSVEIYDSKATYSERAQTYKKNRGLSSGTPDVIGNDDQGRAVYIELKASGGYCSLEQVQFLRRKIDSGAFACVVRSSLELEETYSEWIQSLDKRTYLLSKLPKKAKVNGKLLSL